MDKEVTVLPPVEAPIYIIRDHYRMAGDFKKQGLPGLPAASQSGKSAKNHQHPHHQRCPDHSGYRSLGFDVMILLYIRNEG